MWIKSQIRLTARQPNASPPGYQSPMLGDSTLIPESLDELDANLYHRFTPQTLLNTPHPFTATISHSQDHQEDTMTCLQHSRCVCET